MPPKSKSDSKCLTPRQVKLLVEVHKRANISFSLQQWDEIATSTESKNGKSAESFRYLVNYLQSQVPSKEGQGATADSTPKKRTAETDSVDTPTKKARGTKEVQGARDEESAEGEVSIAQDDQGEAIMEETLMEPTEENTGLGEYSSMLFTQQEMDDQWEAFFNPGHTS